ncbi:MAG TPA: hypothetical protein VD907_01555 [Verrucomicrobiae bacterium]|nr:hypothetical protein [Verrucomicrobiae bacterium]
MSETPGGNPEGQQFKRQEVIEEAQAGIEAIEQRDELIREIGRNAAAIVAERTELLRRAGALQEHYDLAR